MQLTKCLFFVVVCCLLLFLLLLSPRLFSIFIAASEGSAKAAQHLLWLKSWQHAKVWHSFYTALPLPFFLSFPLSTPFLSAVFLRTRPVGSFLCYFLPTSQSEYKQKTVSKFPASDKARVASVVLLLVVCLCVDLAHVSIRGVLHKKKRVYCIYMCDGGYSLTCDSFASLLVIYTALFKAPTYLVLLILPLLCSALPLPLSLSLSLLIPATVVQVCLTSVTSFKAHN